MFLLTRLTHKTKSRHGTARRHGRVVDDGLLTCSSQQSLRHTTARTAGSVVAPSPSTASLHPADGLSSVSHGLGRQQDGVSRLLGCAYRYGVPGACQRACHKFELQTGSDAQWLLLPAQRTQTGVSRTTCGATTSLSSGTLCHASRSVPSHCTVSLSVTATLWS
jgi:hypothetical protein